MIDPTYLLNLNLFGKLKIFAPGTTDQNDLTDKATEGFVKSLFTRNTGEKLVSGDIDQAFLLLHTGKSGRTM